MPWRDVQEANEASVISGNSETRRVNGVECTMLTLEISLEADEKRVRVPEWISCLLHKSIVIRKYCRKSSPRIGLET